MRQRRTALRSLFHRRKFVLSSYSSVDVDSAGVQGMQVNFDKRVDSLEIHWDVA